MLENHAIVPVHIGIRAADINDLCKRLGKSPQDLILMGLDRLVEDAASGRIDWSRGRTPEQIQQRARTLRASAADLEKIGKFALAALDTSEAETYEALAAES